MPSKFSCRQLRETGQRFENFLVDRGQDRETDRERLRTIYNQDFKTRYGPAHSPAPKRGPSLPPLPPRRGHSSRPGARENGSSPSGSGGSRGRAAPPPARCPRPARAASAASIPPALPLPGPCAESGRRTSPTACSPGGGAGHVWGSRVLRPRAARGGWGLRVVSARRGGREPRLCRRAGNELPAEGCPPWRELCGDLRPFIEGLLPRGFTIPES